MAEIKRAIALGFFDGVHLGHAALLNKTKERAAQDAGEGTDFHAVAGNHVSITPLQIDLTHNAQLAMVRSWLQR